MAKRKEVEDEGDPGDPLGIGRRLYAQLGRLLDDLEAADLEEKMTVPQRINALIAIGRIQIMFNTLRRASFDAGYAGSTVRKYAAAFASPHAARGGKAASRTADVIDIGGNDGGDGDYEDGLDS